MAEPPSKKIGFKFGAGGSDGDGLGVGDGVDDGDGVGEVEGEVEVDVFCDTLEVGSVAGDMLDEGVDGASTRTMPGTPPTMLAAA